MLFPLHRLVCFIGYTKNVGYTHLISWQMWFYRWHKAVKQEQHSRLQSSKCKKFQSPEIIWTDCDILLAHHTAWSVYSLFQEVFHLLPLQKFFFLNYHNYHNIKWRVKNRKSDLCPHLMQINHPHYSQHSILSSLSSFHTCKQSCRIWNVSITPDCPNPNHTLSDSVSTEHNSNTILVWFTTKKKALVFL